MALIDGPRSSTTVRSEPPRSAPRPTSNSTLAPLRSHDGFTPAPAKSPVTLSAPPATATPPPPPRSEADALRDAAQLLAGLTPSASAANSDSTVVSDPPDANDPDDTTPSSARYQTAKAQVTANASLEQARLASLSPSDRAAYAQVQASLKSRNDPVAQLALQTMLFKGQLPGAKDLRGEGTTLDNLARLSDSKTTLASSGSGKDGRDDAAAMRGPLLADVVKELATPEAIAQHSANTCGPTAASLWMAKTSPAEYVRLVTGLASPSGTVQLADGSTMTRMPGTFGEDPRGRTPSQRLLENAIVGYAIQKTGLSLAQVSYDETADRYTFRGQPTPIAGMLPFEMGPTMSALTGQRWGGGSWWEKSYGGQQVQGLNLPFGLGDAIGQALVPHDDAAAAAGMQALTQAAAAGQPGMAVISLTTPPSNDPHELHWVDIRSVDDKTVTFMNPWGQVETEDKASFQARLWGYVSGPAGQAPAPTPTPEPVPTPPPTATATPRP